MGLFWASLLAFAASGSATSAPDDPFVPGAPSDVSAEGGYFTAPGQALVHFEAPADDGRSAITSYTVPAMPSGVNNAVADPQLDVYDIDGAVVATNDNWHTPAVAFAGQPVAGATDVAGDCQSGRCVRPHGR